MGEASKQQAFITFQASVGQLAGVRIWEGLVNVCGQLVAWLILMPLDGPLTFLIVDGLLPRGYRIRSL